ncbi:MAG: EF-hand domain-containing protein [Verrucomicrobia bacterium]|nr:EF-hand domain-containing protein [Verrucomicrobiota bacterium]
MHPTRLGRAWQLNPKFAATFYALWGFTDVAKIGISFLTATTQIIMKTKLMMTMGALLGTVLMAGAQGAGERPKGEGRPPGGRPQGPPPHLLEKFDKDKDGKLSFEEREAMKADRQKASEEQRKVMLEKFDADKDGKISPEEREAIQANRQNEMEERRKADFEKFDADKDGKLSYEEFVKLGEYHRSEMMKRFKQGGPRPPGGPDRGDGPDGPAPEAPLAE